MEGGIEHLKAVIIEDKLGICDELERMLQYLVDSYACEWRDVVKDPEKRKLFRQFVNTDATESCIELITERGQQRPANWPSEATSVAQRNLLEQYAQSASEPQRSAAYHWVKVGTVADFPHNGGATIKYGKVQIAVYNFSRRGAWYASQQMCPHKKAFVLSRGIIGDANGVAKIACPLHKKTFSLESGACLSGDDDAVQVFAVKVEGDQVYLKLPPTEVLDRQLATAIGCRLATACNADDASRPVLV